jgi:hypothetical protein
VKKKRKKKKKRCESSKTIWEAEAVSGLFLVLLRKDDNNNDENYNDLFVSVWIITKKTIINSSYSLSATEKHFYFRSEDISIWRKKVKLFMFYNFRVTV